MSHEEEFKAWVEVKEVVVLDKIEGCELSVGDMVTFTNDNGVVFPNHKVLGFTEPYYEGGGVVFLDYDCYWFPAKPENLKKETEQDTKNGNDEGN